MLGKIATVLLAKCGLKVVKLHTPREVFLSDHYLRHNARRLEHLSSLRIPVAGLSVLEVGAGIGDHSHYYIDRNCPITITEARKDNIEYLKDRYPKSVIRYLDVESPDPITTAPFDVVHCYGLLYHLGSPEDAIQFLSHCCKGILLLETCVSFGWEEKVVIVKENVEDPSQAFSGRGCRPTRPWIFSQLKRHFEFVYIPKTQPNHEQFPIDWNSTDGHSGLSRVIFVASKTKLQNDTLTTELLELQSRHE